MKVSAGVRAPDRAQPGISPGAGPVGKQDLNLEARIDMPETALLPGLNRHARGGFMRKPIRKSRNPGAIAPEIAVVLGDEDDPEALEARYLVFYSFDRGHDQQTLGKEPSARRYPLA